MLGDYYGNHYIINEQVVFAKFMINSLLDSKITFAINSDSKFYNRENKRNT